MISAWPRPTAASEVQVVLPPQPRLHLSCVQLVDAAAVAVPREAAAGEGAGWCNPGDGVVASASRCLQGGLPDTGAASTPWRDSC